MVFEEGTIAAISTPPGRGGIGIIRVSGSRAFEIVARHFRKGEKKSVVDAFLTDLKRNSLTYGFYLSCDGNVFDEVMLAKMEAPHSFTCEDVVEIQCHGGAVVMHEILEDLLADGAEAAAPGEFTKRAFLNGRIDLSQAEAVMELIEAKSEKSGQAALDMLQGKLSQRINEVKDLLTALMAQIEVNVDYPEYDIEVLTEGHLREGLNKAMELLQRLLKTYNRGRMLREGIKIVITGKPNVGKSSFLNLLVGHDKAIVSERPGTTRDPVEGYISLEGMPVKVIDTAGIREADDEIEQIGVDRARDILSGADIAVLMVDMFAGVDAEDKKLFEELVCPYKIVLANKTDIAQTDSEILIHIQHQFSEATVISTSMKTEEGLEEFYKAIGAITKAGTQSDTNDVILTNSRHKSLTQAAVDELQAALNALDDGVPNDCVAIDIVAAMDNLGSITGDNIRDDITNEIFSRFCVGK